jgi:hypothetical protein
MSNQLWSNYIRDLAKHKVAASDWPPECTSEIDRSAYIDAYRALGIHIDAAVVRLGAAKRSLFKLLLNNLWFVA